MERLTDELIAIAITGECFRAFVYPVAVFVVAVLGRYGREGFGDAAVESLGFGFFVAHGLFVCWISARFAMRKGQEASKVSRFIVQLDSIDRTSFRTVVFMIVASTEGSRRAVLLVHVRMR